MSDIDNTAIYVSPLEDIIINGPYESMQFTAKKYNTLSFRSLENNLIKVNISGEIQFPGTYVLNDNATIEDLYQLAGDFNKQANLNGIVLTRQSLREKQLLAIQNSKEELNKAILLSSQKGEFLDINNIQLLSESIEPRNLGRLAGNFAPKSLASRNTILSDGDNIIVPKNLNSISIIGEVLSPISIEYKKKYDTEFAINSAGGYSEYADKRRVYIIKANGSIKKVSRNIFVRNIKIEPGDTIVVPRKISTGLPGIEALIPITNILSDLAFSAAALDNLTSN